MTRLTRAQFQSFLERDGWRCICCSSGGSDLVPNHRANRGMGGSKRREAPSNIVVMCSRMNGDIESDPAVAARARAYGWKLESWQDPAVVPVYDPFMCTWYLLDDELNRTPTNPPEGGTLATG